LPLFPIAASKSLADARIACVFSLHSEKHSARNTQFIFIQFLIPPGSASGFRSQGSLLVLFSCRCICRNRSIYRMLYPAELPDCHQEPRIHDLAEEGIILTRLDSFPRSASSYAMIFINFSASRLAPPTSAPSISGMDISSAMFSGFTEPPY